MLNLEREREREREGGDWCLGFSDDGESSERDAVSLLFHSNTYPSLPKLDFWKLEIFLKVYSSSEERLRLPRSQILPQRLCVFPEILCTPQSVLRETVVQRHSPSRSLSGFLERAV